MPDTSDNLDGGDLAASVLLWVLHVPLALLTFVVAAFTAFVTDPCGYEPCGDPRWTQVADGTAIITAIVLWTGSLALGIRRLRRRDRAWPVAAWACALQLLMIPIVIATGNQAGPVS
ncbi:hypothetical protein [Gordonia metallireducens]|uniref:hypothetical protein n=1 Tax=Gordonia metallireducens TaxID=2897779 RepID=UPI001E65663F|nr:hypothetical protein [Gordonia metallireducens]